MQILPSKKYIHELCEKVRLVVTKFWQDVMVWEDGKENCGRCRSRPKSGWHGQLFHKMMWNLQSPLGTDNCLSKGVSGDRWIMTEAEEEVMEEDDNPDGGEEVCGVESAI